MDSIHGDIGFCRVRGSADKPVAAVHPVHFSLLLLVSMPVPAARDQMDPVPLDPLQKFRGLTAGMIQGSIENR